ncbi:MAG TPA: sigma-70 family RNA polymerase sigma factor [Pyrinomonadaceae bacterium]|nr:sigma-70 family RNA polymerase sigma factor [Pyrinomonadaceae bacterium]
MEPLPRQKKGWDLSEKSLAGFMSALDEDPERAGERYEILRRKLMKFFEWRGSVNADELADETINRLVRKIEEGEDIRNLFAYSCGMARLVWLEVLKEQEWARGALEELNASSQYSSQAGSQRIECFESCLEGLTPENRALILDYYRAEKSGKIKLRKQLAEKLGTPVNALRIRAHRIRRQLERCVHDCLSKAEGP